MRPLFGSWRPSGRGGWGPALRCFCRFSALSSEVFIICIIITFTTAIIITTTTTIIILMQLCCLELVLVLYTSISIRTSASTIINSTTSTSASIRTSTRTSTSTSISIRSSISTSARISTSTSTSTVLIDTCLHAYCRSQGVSCQWPVRSFS